jgi:16S rRNA A1518/A1519 N6-dimethyltransferase RsmA/KsgA/DIM1 with predicted DNA glycosylase/AP lyase activity
MGVLRSKDVVELLAPHEIGAGLGAIIAALLAAGSTVYSVEENKSTANANRKEQEKLAAEQAAAAKAASAPKATTASNFPDIAAQMKAKLAASRANQPGLSSDFYLQELEQENPGFEAIAKQIVSSDYGGSGK